MSQRKNTTRLENYVQCFVLQHVAEPVYVDLKDAISMKHQKKYGSTMLGPFWVNVLQEPSNFPCRTFPYKQLIDRTTDVQKLILKAEDVTFTVFMDTGTLMLQGPRVYDWFTQRMEQVLDAYDPLFRDQWDYRQARGVRCYEEDEPRDPPYHLTETEEYLQLMSKKDKPDERMDKLIDSLCEELVPGLERLNLDERVWTGEELVHQLKYLDAGAVRDGYTFIYKLWKSLLSRWFSEAGTKVYVVSPFMDSERLCDIIDLYLPHYSTAEIEAIYTRKQCDESKTIAQIKQTALAKYDPKTSAIIEYKILRRVILPMNRFHCKFIACLRKDVAEILVTSANFHGSHFACKNMETVSFTTMPASEFIEQYINPLAQCFVATTY